MQFDTASRFLFRYWNFWHFSVLPSFCYFQAIERAMSAFGTLRVPALSCWCSVRARQGVGTAVSFKLSDFRPRSGPRPGPRGLICLASGGCCRRPLCFSDPGRAATGIPGHGGVPSWPWMGLRGGHSIHFHVTLEHWVPCGFSVPAHFSVGSVFWPRPRIWETFSSSR